MASNFCGSVTLRRIALTISSTRCCTDGGGLSARSADLLCSLKRLYSSRKIINFDLYGAIKEHLGGADADGRRVGEKCRSQRVYGFSGSRAKPSNSLG